jgi:hypothetical protein
MSYLGSGSSSAGISTENNCHEGMERAMAVCVPLRLLRSNDDHPHRRRYPRQGPVLQPFRSVAFYQKVRGHPSKNSDTHCTHRDTVVSLCDTMRLTSSLV